MNQSDIILTVISIIGSLSSITSLLISMQKSKKKSEIQEDSQSKPNRWPIVTILLATMVSFCMLIIWIIFYSGVNAGWGVLATFVVSFISLIIYAIKANQSLDSYYVLPPQSLWQVLFNKIPSHIQNTNQLVFKFIVLKMEDSDEVNEAGQKIKEDYRDRQDFQVDVHFYHEETKLEVTADYCGVIFIVGEQCFNRQKEVLKCMDEYSKQLALPIAYIRVGDNHYRLSKYHRISARYLDKNCANHLIMRSYRRSEHWIRLSQLSHTALWTLITLAVLSFGAFVMVSSSWHEQKKNLDEAKREISILDSNLRLFGNNRNVIHLSNTYDKRMLPDTISIDSLQNDVDFKYFVEGFAMYFFDEVKPKKILLWMRNSGDNELKCVYDSNNNGELKRNKDKGEDTMIGGIANHKGTFVLWPGCKNNDSIWRDPNKNKMAWFNEDNGAFSESILVKDSGRNVKLKLIKSQKQDPIFLTWSINKEKNHNDDDLALYGFSFDGRLAIELDFDYNKLNTNEDLRVYIQNLVFRNSVRKFLACMTSYIDCWDQSKKKKS